MKFYIKERTNPQTGTYYVACGKMSRAQLKKAESPIYGSNAMTGFATKAEYEARLAQLRASGARVQ